MSNKANFRLEKLIGKPIDEASKFGKIIKGPDHYYRFESKPITDFFDESCGDLLISIDTNKEIESLIVPFPTLLDKSFYIKFTKAYGIPSSILASDELLSESKSNNVGDDLWKQNLSKRVYSLKEVAFEDKPFFILWNNKDHQIKMTFSYKYNATQLVFRKPTDRF